MVAERKLDVLLRHNELQAQLFDDLSLEFGHEHVGAELPSLLGTSVDVVLRQAARRAAKSGAHTVIASGRETDVLLRLAKGEAIGTELSAHTPRVAARKAWLSDHLQVRGALTLDAGATKALVLDGKSLLAIGVTAVSGEFERGELVAIRTIDGREIARGLINYGAADARRIMRRPSNEIEATLGFVDEAELVHRDNLVLIS